MAKQFEFKCSRCGGETKISRVWKEMDGPSEVETTERVCVNPKCQTSLNSEMASIRKRRQVNEERQKNWRTAKKVDK